MTRRAGGADSRPADQTHHRYTTAPHSTTASRQKRQIPARPRAAHSTAQPAQSVPIGQHHTATDSPHSRHTASQQDSTARRVMKRDTHELYRTQAILLTRRAAHASNIAHVARLIRAHVMGARAVIRVEGGARTNSQFSSRGIAPTACSMHQLSIAPTASHSKRYSVLHEQPRHPYTERLSGP